MELTREIYEKVFKDFNKWLTDRDDYLDSHEHNFLNHKFQNREGWFYNPENKWMMFIKDGNRWGWHGGGEWAVDSADHTAWNRLKPAPEHLVIERVKEELEKRGYKEGVEVECLSDNKSYSLNKDEHCQFQHQLISKGSVCMVENQRKYGVLIMEQGKWAAIQTPSIHDELNALIKRAKEEGMEVEVIFKNK